MVASLRKAGLRDDVDRAGELASVYANGVCVLPQRHAQTHFTTRLFQNVCLRVCVFLP